MPAFQAIAVWDGLVINAANAENPPVPNVEAILFTSDVFPNTFDHEAITVEMHFEIDPGLPGNQIFIGTLLQQQDANGKWHDIAHDYTPFAQNNIAQTRIIELNTRIFNPSSEYITVAPVDDETARISPKNGKLGNGDMRIQLMCKDKNDPIKFVSLTVSADVSMTT